ncbi:MAG: cell division protein FtsL [Betaproteobacteria bacterium]|nr:cell division protein FtsL [Betaproteobacteria bacterium]
MTRLNLALLAVLMICAIALVTSQHHARKLYVQLEQELEREKKYELEFSRLQREQGEWSTHARVAKIATQNLRMRAPSAERTQLVPFVAYAPPPAVEAAK